MHTEIVKRISELPIAERVEIIEEVSRSVRRDLQKNGKNSDEQAEIVKKRREAIKRLRGIAAVEGKTAPSDQEVKEDYYNYLAEKYK
ncbi:MAG: hypothetical protein WBO10_17055 [Pyrinomonadaceae bacterium]